MLRREALSLSALFLAGPLLAQVSAPPASQAETSPAPAGQPSDDLKRMRALLEQMQMGLAYLPAGYSAVKHQFELQNEMFAALLNHLERAG